MSKNNTVNKLVTLGLIFTSFIQAPLAMAAGDIQTASFIINGDVPAIFNMTIRAVPGSLDFNPSATVVARTLATVHFRINEDVASLNFSSSTNNGYPRLAGAAAGVTAVATWTIGLGACAAWTPNAAMAMNAIANVVTDIKPAAPLTQGYDVDCTISGDWTTSAVPGLAGSYSSVYTLVMTSG